MRLPRCALLMLVLLVLCLPSWSQSTTPVTVQDHGGFVRITSGAAESANTGYGRLDSQDGNSAPAGLAIFAFRQNGVLVTEAAVPASALIEGGRIYAEIQEAARTGKTMSELVESALRLSLGKRAQSRRDLPELPTFDSGGALVDVSDRDALYGASYR